MRTKKSLAQKLVQGIPAEESRGFAKLFWDHRSDADLQWHAQVNACTDCELPASPLGIFNLPGPVWQRIWTAIRTPFLTLIFRHDLVDELLRACSRRVLKEAALQKQRKLEAKKRRQEALGQLKNAVGLVFHCRFRGTLTVTKLTSAIVTSSARGKTHKFLFANGKWGNEKCMAFTTEEFATMAEVWHNVKILVQHAQNFEFQHGIFVLQLVLQDERVFVMPGEMELGLDPNLLELKNENATMSIPVALIDIVARLCLTRHQREIQIQI